MTSIDALIAKVKANPDYPKAGMIRCHNGVVRGSSRDGRPVDGLKMSVNQPKLEEIIARQKSRDGIVEVLVEIADSDQLLKVGDDVMYLVVAGDIRENVLNVLTDTLNEIKSTVTAKTENFID